MHSHLQPVVRISYDYVKPQATVHQPSQDIVVLLLLLLLLLPAGAFLGRLASTSHC
jgi:hypothetical protein